MNMKDNRGITLIELVVVIAISVAILLSIYSFYTVGVRGFARETTTATNQVSIRRVSNEIARQIRRASDFDVTNPQNLILKYEDKDIAKIEYIFDSSTKTITAYYYKNDASGDSNISDHTSQLSNRISDFNVNVDEKKITMTIESIENVDMSSRDNHKDSLTTVITKR